MSDLLDSAREYAQEMHQGQTRKGKEVPYFAHVEQVARNLSNYGFSDEVIAAGYLHDVTEDVERINVSDIEEEFGIQVARLVDGASEHDKSASWQERKQHTLDYLKEEATIEEIAVKVSDKIDNVRSMRQEESYQGDDFWEKFNAPYKDQAWYHTELTNIVGQRLEEDFEVEGEINGMYDELKQEVDQVFG